MTSKAAAGISLELRAAARRGLLEVEAIAEGFVRNTLARNLGALSRIQAPPARLREVAHARIAELLQYLASGDRAGYLALVIDRLRTGGTSGQQYLGKLGVSLSEYLQTLTAQKLALIQWLECLPLDAQALLALVTEIEFLYLDIMTGYAETFPELQADYLRLSAQNTQVLELNQRLERKAAEIMRRNEELRLIAAVSRALTLTGSLDEVLTEGLGALCRLLRTKLGAIWLWDDAADGIQIRASCELDDALRQRVNTSYHGLREGSPVLTCYFGRKTVAVTDATEYDDFAPLTGYAQSLGFRSTIFLPLVYQGDAWGVLSLYWEEPRSFPEREQQLLRSFSDQMAVAIRVATLVQDLDRARKSLEAQVQDRTRELSQQKHLAVSILDHAPAAIAVIDRALVLRRVNPEYARLVRRPEEQLLDQPLFGILRGSESQIEGLVKQVFETGKPLRGQGFPFTWQGLEGPIETHWDFSCVPLEANDGQTETILFLGIEVSERVEKERLQRQQLEHLRQIDALKDQFLSILSHELRTPVNAITGFGSILEDEVAGPLSPQQHEYLQKMLKGADVLLALINDLLDMSRIQAGKFSLNPRYMALDDVAADVVAHLKPLAEQRHHRLEVEIPVDLPPLMADEQRIAQVLTNLVNNAIKFTPNGGLIRVRARVEGDRLQCEVIDNGPGIAADQQARLFMPFTQLDMSSTRREGGTGLGLSISKALIEAHSGEIGVESGPGRGSTFWFTLPVERPAGP